MSTTDDSQKVSSLSWVKDEVDKSLGEARIALEAYVEDGDKADRSKLELCQTMIQQVRGTLQMVQMRGATVLTEEMENLANALLDERDAIEDANQAYEALMRAILQLPDYLEKVQQGQSDLAIILLPLINDLRAAHGQNAVATRSLFAPNFNGILPNDMAEGEKQDLAGFIRSNRHQIHLAMLGIFRNRKVDEAFSKLIGLYASIRNNAVSESVIQMYWAAMALVEAIRDGGLESDMPVNPLLGQVDRQSKRIIDNGEEPIAAEPPTELIRLLLFYVASASSSGDLVRSVKEAFKLESYLPSEDDLDRLRDNLSGPGSEVLGKVVMGIRQEIDRARDMLDIYTRTGEQDQEKLELMEQALRNVGGTIAMVGDQELQQSINVHCDGLRKMIDGEPVDDETFSLDALADFILKVDNRLQDLSSTKQDRPSMPVGESAMGNTGMWEVMSAVVRESSINMSSAKDAISEFAEAPDDKRSELEVVTGLLQQVAGGLKIASLDRASNVIYALRTYVDSELIQNQQTPTATQMESLAEVVSSADYYLDAVVNDLPNKESALELAEAALELLGYAPDISSRYQALDDDGGEEPEDETYEIGLEDEAGDLEEIEQELQQAAGDEPDSASDEFEIDPESLKEDEIDDAAIERATVDVDEQGADIEEVEVVAPAESEEELAARLAEDAEPSEALPTLEAVEEDAPELEEVAVDAPQESEEEMLARVQGDLADTSEQPVVGEIEVEDAESELEELSLGSDAQMVDSDDGTSTSLVVMEEVSDVSQAADEVSEVSIMAEDSGEMALPDDIEVSGVSQRHSALSQLQSKSNLSELSPLGEDFDEEIVDIFLEEADEVISNLKTQFPIWNENIDNKDALGNIRRSFHTLKGSGRMVGANLIGEFAWEVENMLNHVIDKTRKADRHVLDVVSQAIQALPGMVGQLQGGPAPEDDVIAIANRAHDIATGNYMPEHDEVVIEEIKDAPQRASDDSSSISQIVTEATPSSPLYSDELRRVYTDETRSHVATMRKFIERCEDGGSRQLEDEQLRVLHTLHGGAATVGADALKEYFDVAEPLAILHKGNQSPVDEDLLQLIIDLMDEVDAFLSDINGGDGVYRLNQELQARLIARMKSDQERLEQVDLGPGLGVMSSSEEESTKVVGAVEEAPLKEIESSLEDLHDIMSPDDDSSVEQVASEDSQSEIIALEDDDEIDQEMFDVFLEEVGELLVNVETVLQDWQDSPDDKELVINVQRDIHTMKGGARMLSQQVFADISHAMETLLMAITESGLPVVDAMFGVLHEARDSLQDIYEGMRQDSAYKPAPRPDLVQKLEAFLGKTPDEEDVDEDELFDEEGEPSMMAIALESVDKEEPEYDEELFEIFIDEARDLMVAIDQSLHDWHSDPANEDLIVTIQRDMHTLKGGARMVNQKAIGDLGHCMETLLASVADGNTAVTEELFKVLYQAKDNLQDMFEALVDGDHGQVLRTELIDQLEAIRTGKALEQKPSRQTSPDEAVTDELPTVPDDSETSASQDNEQTPSGALPTYTGEETPSGAMAALPNEETPSGGVEALIGEETPSGAETALSSDETPSGAMEPYAEEESTSKAAASVEGRPGSDRRKRTRIEQGTIRVRSDLIDNLVNLAGETNIFRSRLEQQSNTFRFSLGELDQTVTRLRDQLRKLELETETQILFRHETELDTPDQEKFDPLEMDRYSQLQQLSRSLVESVGDLDSLQDMLGGLTRDNELLLVQQGRVNTELQGRLMQARVVPFAASLASRLRRIIRQTCQQLDKKAELRLVGANEEMDRHVLDRMVAPLEHMLRNAIAHGIESPEQRKQRGKPEVGTVTISVGREGGEIVIQVADDGGGLDVNAIRNKAVSKNMIVENADMTDEDVMQLVLQPGFSTAESVSQIAGRGVGMDVVHNEIKQLGGSLHIESVIERGAAITIRLPFTLAINQALLVRVAGDLYAIPLNSIEGVSRVSQQDMDEIEASGEEKTYTYGGDEYRISQLGRVLGKQTVEQDQDNRPAIIMVRAGGHRVAFNVDALMGHHEIVVKSLGAQISSVNGLAGGTILGDGRVALILDIPALVRMVSAEYGLTEVEEVAMVETPEKVGVTVMVVDDSITVRRVTTRLLERHDMRVLTAKDGVEAVAMLEDDVPDVMLLDVEMPRMDGYEVASHMRNDERYKKVPILMITSRTGAKHRERAEAIGVDRYLGKPYQESELLTNISEVLEGRRAE